MSKVTVEITFDVGSNRTELEVLEDMKEFARTINYDKWITEYVNVTVAIKSFDVEESPYYIQ